MANMTFKANLLPNTNLGYSLGSSDLKWNIYGSITPAGTTGQFYRGDNIWSNEISGGLLKITNNSNTVSIGSQNANFCHIYNNVDVPFIFNKDILTTDNHWLGSTSYPWGGLRLGGTGEIQYQGTNANYTMIKMIDNTNDNYGNGIRIGGGGLTIIGGGESSITLQNNLGYTGGSEVMVVGSDGSILFYPGQDSYDASAQLSMTASRFWAGVNGNTTREAQVGVQSGAGQLYMWSHAATTGSRGLYSPAHGSGTARALVTIDTNNRVYFADSYNGTSTALAYSQAGLAASAITWLTCWNGYELRAISKAEMANAVDSAHKWVRIGGDTVTGQIQKASLGKSWFQGRDGALIRNTTTAYTNNWYNPIVSVKSINGTWDIGTYTTNNSLYFTYITDANYNSSTNTPVAQMEFRGSDNSIRASKVYGAVWNDYAEYRKDNPIEKEKQEPGRCVHELGNGALALTTERLMRGCEIISDTFGFAIGQDEENGYNTPIASSGRVLVYPYESIEEFKTHIGYCVCSGPNGTVSIMTDEEEEKYPGRIIGTISEIPNYEEWGTGKIKVDGRIWIRIR